MRRAAGAVAGMGLALATIALSWSSLEPAQRRLPGDHLLPDVTTFRPLPPEAGAIFMDSRAGDTPTDLRQIGRMLLANPDDGSPESVERLDRAVASLEAALRQAPADGFAWADLALARLRRDGPTAQGLDALRLSIATAPAEPALVLWRVDMMLHHILFFTADDEQLLERQLLNSWSFAPWQTVQFLKERHLMWRLRVALQNDPAELQRLTVLEKMQ